MTYNKIHYQENKNQYRIRRERWEKKNPEKVKLAKQKWAAENKEYSKEQLLKYRIKNRESLRLKWKDYYHKTREQILLRSRENKKRYMTLWSEFIPMNTKCAMCDKDIGFNKSNSDSAIHFDHRNGGNESIKGCPTRWLNGHKPLKHNVSLFKECNFGMLCSVCNRCLPTKDREMFVLNAIKYVFGITINKEDLRRLQ
jgi:hypothetical protein